MAIFAPKLARPFKAWAELDPYLPESLASRQELAQRWCRVQLLGSLSTSCAAWLGSLPLMLWHFHSVTPVALVANLVQVPLSFLCLVTAALSALAAVVMFHPGQVLLNHANLAFAKATIWVAQIFAAVPGGNYVWQPQQSSAAATMTLSVLSLPDQHAAAFLQSGAERWMLDCGSERDAARVLMPYLRYSGVQHLDGLILSHGDTDHAGAAPLLMQLCQPTQIYAGPLEPWALDTRQTTLWKVQERLQKDHRQLLHLQLGSTLQVGQTQLLTLYPSAQERREKADDRCLILQLHVAEQRILLCADMGYSTEQTLLQHYRADELQSEVLIADQHASGDEPSVAFLETVSPRFLISSVPPSIRRSELYQKLGIETINPRQHGMVEVRAEAGKLTLHTWLSRQTWQVPPRAKTRLTH
jgi:competence protein ComEC